jgi:aspartokinase-like uncharacterized kinase
MSRAVAAHVVKVGGSLLERDGIVPALARWVSDCQRDDPESHLVMLIGGGTLVEALRDIDRRHHVDPALAHWIAIELMDVAARIVGGWFPTWRVETSLASLRARVGTPGVTLFLPYGFLRNDDPQLAGLALPVGWHVTSDSIAARLAEVLGGARLTLLKSCPLEGRTWAQAAHEGLVDGWFPRAVASLQNVAWDCPV